MNLFDEPDPVPKAAPAPAMKHFTEVAQRKVPFQWRVRYEHVPVPAILPTNRTPTMSDLAYHVVEGATQSWRIHQVSGGGNPRRVHAADIWTILEALDRAGLLTEPVP